MTDPASSTPVPVSLKSDGDALMIAWSDGAVHRLRWSVLRDRCPCASCRTRRDEPPPLLPVLSPAEARPVRPVAMRPVGNYAYNVEFSDGHHSGIYSFELLRRLGEEGGGRP